jgi:hypothetical protein
MRSPSGLAGQVTAGAPEGAPAGLGGQVTAGAAEGRPAGRGGARGKPGCRRAVRSGCSRPEEREAGRAGRTAERVSGRPEERQHESPAGRKRGRTSLRQD